MGYWTYLALLRISRLEGAARVALRALLGEALKFAVAFFSLVLDVPGLCIRDAANQGRVQQLSQLDVEMTCAGILLGSLRCGQSELGYAAPPALGGLGQSRQYMVAQS